ncbi:hypothetical protein CTI12_AA531720 [Artemisia annua]|uniref:Uncharacterized protein n=1 Tax=Artemisia annua TaxID=35608 RepID=A0A2U1L4D5_ARTAN|nr:hypothetical protein CTI12_AA531720 [Artemisia annua]
MENCCVSAAYTSSSPSLLYPKNPLPLNTHFIHKNTRPSLSIKAASSFKTLNNNSTLSSNWDVVGPTSAAPAWMPKFEELDTTNMLLRQRIVFLGSQYILSLLLLPD